MSLKGNALFDIAGNRARPFFIETGKVQIEVIGTAFHVRNSGNSPFELAVQRGEVKVTQKQNGHKYMSRPERPLLYWAMNGS